MFFPFKDDNPSTKYPYVTAGIIIVNVIIYLASISGGAYNFKLIVLNYGLIPTELLHMKNLYISPDVNPFITIFTSMFLHANLAHLIGNMWYLWIFGDNVEDFLGHFNFLIFYIAGGVASGLIHSIFNPSSTMPVIGASGAVSAVLGAYMLLYPAARVYVLFFFIFIFRIFTMPAAVLIGFWIFFQILNGLTSLGVGQQVGGVAWFAHIGGFFYGLYFIKFVVKSRMRYNRLKF